MKGVLAIVAFNIAFVLSWAQPPPTVAIIPGNSVEDLIDTSIRYNYNEQEQIHNYSGNWDIDGDKTTDSLFFIGNGGAHLYYHLKLILSKDKKPIDFYFLMLDMPVLSSATELKKSNPFFPSFVVSDFDADGLADVYLNFDITFSSIPPKWKKQGVSSRCVLVQYKNGKLVIKNFKKQL